MFSTNNTVEVKSQGGGRVGGVVFGIFWTLFSSIFVVVGITLSFAAWKDSRWEEVPCEVFEFKVNVKKKQNSAFEPKASYEYLWEGLEYEGTSVLQSGESSESYADFAKLEHQFRNKELKFCYVNPSNPDESALIRGGLSGVFLGVAFATFGLMFALIGIGMIFFSGGKKRSLSDEASSESGKLATIGMFFVGLIFFGAFALGGSAVFISGVKGSVVLGESDQWVEVPATVIWSRVVSDSSGDGTSYTPEVFYRYQFRGHNFRMNDDISCGISSGGYKSKKAKADKYPKGRKIQCLVNKQKPWKSRLPQEAGGNQGNQIRDRPLMTKKT